MATLEQKEAARRQREQRDKRICSDYLTLLEQNPNAALYCLLDTLAQRYTELNKKTGTKTWPQTAPGIRNVITRGGLLSK